MKKNTISHFLLATTVLQLAQPYLVKAEENKASQVSTNAVATKTATDDTISSGQLAGSATVNVEAKDEANAQNGSTTTSALAEETDAEKSAVVTTATTVTEEKGDAKTSATSIKAMTTLDDSKLKAWIDKHHFQFVQTLFRTDGENKEIHANVDGYQAPFDLKGYTYLSSIITSTDKGPSLVHIYRDASYVDKAIVRTEYYDGTSGKKIQEDQKGQAFLAEIGKRKYYYDVIVEENGEKVYKIFYLTDQDFIDYGGSEYYVRLTDYTRFIDQATGQEIATQQQGFIPIYDVSGYHFVSAEIIEEKGLSYFVQSFAKDETPTEVGANVSEKGAEGQEGKVANQLTTQTNRSKTALPSTGDVKSLAVYIGLGLLAVLAFVGLRRRHKK